MSYMEFEAVIPEGGWSSLGHEMCTSDEESEFMCQLLANCSVANDMNEASSSAIPFAICPSHEYSPTNNAGIDQVPHYSSEIANLYFSNGSSTYSFANNQNYYTNESNQIMPRNFCNFESFCHWNANDTNLFLNQGEEYGIAHLELSNGNVEEYSGKNQPGGAIYEQILQLNPTMESEVTVSENSNKRPCSSVEVQKKKRNVKPKKGKKPVLTIDIEDNDASCKGQSSSSCSGDGDSNASQQDLSGGVSPSSSSPKGLADLNLNCKTKASRGSATDSQSIYARKRREKINSRLRILQNLVPNCSKVDISTMLEEAVQYVKFLQLQIKLLSSEDMWMYAPIAYNGIDIGMDLNS